jgi:hypothetical protein
MGIGKVYRKIMILMVLISGALFLQCLTDNDDKNTCDDTKAPRIEPMFRIHLKAQYQDGTAYVGSAKYNVHKQYCNGNISGQFRDSIWTVNYGYWKPITAEYIMENDSDVVTSQFFILNLNNLGRTYYYNDVAHRSYIDEFGQRIFEDTIYVTIYP